MSRQSPNGTYWKKRALKAEIDAKRYRWWRKRFAGDDDSMDEINEAFKFGADTEDEVDACLDAAMSPPLAASSPITKEK